MRWMRRSLLVFGLLLGVGVVGCQSQSAEVAPIPPVRKADSSGMLLNNGAIQLGPGAGDRNGYRPMPDAEWGL